MRRGSIPLRSYGNGSKRMCSPLIVTVRTGTNCARRSRAFSIALPSHPLTYSLTVAYCRISLSKFKNPTAGKSCPQAGARTGRPADDFLSIMLERASNGRPAQAFLPWGFNPRPAERLEMLQLPHLGNHFILRFFLLGQPMKYPNFLWGSGFVAIMFAPFDLWCPGAKR